VLHIGEEGGNKGVAQAELHLPPAPRGRPVVGNGPDLARDLVQTFIDGWQQAGDTFRFPLPGSSSIYVFVHPDSIQHVLEDAASNYPKLPTHTRKFKLFVGEGLFTSEGEVHEFHRRLAEPVFQRERISSFVPMMVDSTRSMLARWAPLIERGETIDILSEMMNLTLTIVMRTLFSADVGGEAETIAAAVRACNKYVYERLQSVVDLHERLPMPARRRFHENRRVLDDYVYALIQERRSSKTEADDLLSRFLRAQDERTGKGMSDIELRDAVVTIFLGGYETTALALTWTFYLLSMHPEVGRQLDAELDEILGDRIPTAEDLKALRFTRMVLLESLRLYPTVFTISRMPLSDDVIDGYHVPAGSQIFLSPYLTHRHPGFWENPEGFDPERFSPERSAARHPLAYFPFSVGPRRCAGFPIAMMEAPLIVALVRRMYRLAVAPGYRPTPVARVFLFPKDGMPMFATRAEDVRDGQESLPRS
jgi:cytochrome P450